MLLGGYVAEELIFGKENLTSGASSDIEKATQLVSSMFKEEGMGNTPMSFSIPSLQNNYGYNNITQIEEEIKSVIIQGLELAKKTLNNEKKLLLAMSNYLADHSYLKKEEIEKLINTYSLIHIDYITNGDLLFYRNHLKEKVFEQCIDKPSKHFESVSLNRKITKDLNKG
jgi:ATP-dependent Zn protease